MPATRAEAGLFIGASRAAIAVRSAPATSVIEKAFADSDELDRALGELLASAPKDCHLTVALGRPLAHLRTVALPPMAREVAERVLSRDRERYVIGNTNGAHTVAARSLDRATWVAAFASRSLVERITAAATRASIGSVTIAAVDDVLSSAAHDGLPAGARAEARIIVACDATGPTDVAVTRGSTAVGGRQLLAGASAADVTAYANEQGVPRASVVVLGQAEHAERFASEYGRSGMQSMAIPAKVDGNVTSAGVLAYFASAATPTLPLRADEERARAGRESRATTAWMLVGAAAALVLSLVLEQAVISSRLRQVTEQRAALAPSVRRLIASRDSAQADLEQAAAFADREMHASRVGGVLASIAIALPGAAALSTLQISGDSVSIEGESANGGAVYDALRTVTALEQVKLAAPLRRERPTLAGTAAVDHFAFSARLRGGVR